MDTWQGFVLGLLVTVILMIGIYVVSRLAVHDELEERFPRRKR